MIFALTLSSVFENLSVTVRCLPMKIKGLPANEGGAHTEDNAEPGIFLGNALGSEIAAGRRPDEP